MVVARTDDQVITELRTIYREQFAGKERARYLISWADLRSLYGFEKLYNSRFEQLAERAVERGLYLFDLGQGDKGHMVAVLLRSTADRWRRASKIVIQDHLPPPSSNGDGEDDEDDED
jgi:hypothetical protein